MMLGFERKASCMMMAKGPNQVPLPQAVLGPLTRAAIFLVVTIKPEPECYAAVRSFCGDLAGLIGAVEFRDIEAGLACIIGFGSNAWGGSLAIRGQLNCIPSAPHAGEQSKNL
jgi:deferrochelatase/peroxidase EfeB